jgi:ferredoxin
MGATIYWFSGTGNSLAVAKEIADKLPGAELIPIAEAVNRPPEAAEVIGIVCPVYAWGPPALVARFIRKMKASPQSYIFAVMTYAGSPGGAPRLMQGLFQKRGLDLHAAWGVKMPENFPPLGSAPEPEKQQEIQGAADEKIARIAEELRSLPRGHFETPGRGWKLLSRIVYPSFRAFLRHRADRFFRADSRCNGCGLCAGVCPVQNIEMVDGRPQWKGRCEQCYACFHWCPQRAVQYGRSARLRRYHHPRTSVADFMR